MNKIKRTLEDAWADYCWMCDQTRYDEALALVGALTMAWYGLWALSWITSIAGCGTSFLGLPMLVVAHTAWRHRTR